MCLFHPQRVTMEEHMNIVGESHMRDWMQTLYEDNGYLTPQIVLEAARPEDSPAHAFVFGVDAKEAAELHYLDRAHDLIRRVKVRIVSNNEPSRKLRFFHAVPGEEEASFVYHSIETLARQTDKLERTRNEALRRMRDAERGVEDLNMIVEDATQARRGKRALTKIKQAREELVGV